MPKDIKEVVSENVRMLLGAGATKPTGALMSLGFSNGTATRILKGTTDLGLGLVAELAKALRVEPWQLLAPGLDPNRLPTLAPMSFRWPFRQVDPEVLLNLSGTPAQQIENGLLTSMATAGVSPRTPKQPTAAVSSRGDTYFKPPPVPEDHSSQPRPSSPLRPAARGTSAPKRAAKAAPK